MRSSSNQNPCSSPQNERIYRSDFLPFGLLTTTSMDADLRLPPFHTHSLTPPPRRTTPRRSMFDDVADTGVARISDNASIRFDLPAAFGPMRMLRFSNAS